MGLARSIFEVIGFGRRKMKSGLAGAVQLLVLSMAVVLGAAAQSPSAQEHSAKALALVKIGDLGAAEKELRDAVRLSPESPVYLSDLASVLRAQKKLDEPGRGSIR